MAESKTISRQIGDGDRYGFTNLRTEGIELAQNLSGSDGLTITIMTLGSLYSSNSVLR